MRANSVKDIMSLSLVLILPLPPFNSFCSCFERYSSTTIFYWEPPVRKSAAVPSTASQIPAPAPMKFSDHLQTCMTPEWRKQYITYWVSKYLVSPGGCQSLMLANKASGHWVLAKVLKCNSLDVQISLQMWWFCSWQWWLWIRNDDKAVWPMQRKGESMHLTPYVVLKVKGSG